MNPSEWQRIKDVYSDVLDLPAEQRSDYLADLERSEPGVAREVRRMLAADPSKAFLEPPSADVLFGGGLEGMRLGDFELEREIGRGGMGVVYLARQEGLDRPAAVKILPLSRQGDDDARERFRREARAASRLDHPRIAAVLAFGEGETSAWYAMRYVEGHDLHEEIVRQGRAAAGSQEELLLPPFGGPDYVPFLVERVAELAEALQLAHDSGIVHRDVKPHNILIDREGRLYLADFGLAKDERFGTLSASDDVRGTPHYMSPEQARAVRDPIDHRTDLYSLAVVLYEMLTLRRPHEGRTSHEILHKIATREPSPLRHVNPRVPRDLAVICEKAMSKRAVQRYDTMGELAGDLRRFLGHEAIEARPPGLAERGRRFFAAHRVAAAAVGAAVLALLAGVWIQQWSERRSVQAGLNSDLVALLERNDWERLTDRLVDARKRVLALGAGGAELSGPLADSVELFEGRLAELRERTLAESEARIERGLGGRAGDPQFGAYLSPADEQELFGGLLQLSRLRAVFWDDEVVQDAADLRRALPEIAIEFHPSMELDAIPRIAAASARLWPIDPFHDALGEARLLGQVPLESAFVPPGYYRIEVEIPGYGACELTRHLRAGPELQRLEVRIPPPEGRFDGMVSLEAAILDLGEDPPLGCLDVGGTVEVAAFRLDEAEVSNRQFAAFLEASGHPAPLAWRLYLGYEGDWRQMPVIAGFEEVWPDLPAVALDWYDALAYAEWHGKRLPTHLEQERAFRGPEMLLFPPTDPARPDEGRANIDGPSSTDWAEFADSYRTYLEHAVAVRAEGYRQQPGGLFHAFGNVSEWSSSMLVEPQRGQLVAFPYSRITMGGGWDAAVYEEDLSRHPMRGIDQSFANSAVGFRCASSVTP